MPVIDHVALVVESLEATLQKLSPYNVSAGPISEFPDEGTREVYLSEKHQAALLLMQPLGTIGPYAEAVARRGFGLHHIGINVPSLEQTIGQLAGSGWYLHLQSFSSIKHSHTAWLARPGVGVLIELHESKNSRAEPALITNIEVPVSSSVKQLFEALELADVGYSEDAFAWLTLGGTRLRADQLGRG